MAAPRISAREARTVRIGAIVALIALSVAYGVVPFVRHWREREDAIATQSERLGRLRGLITSESRLQALVEERSAVLAARPQRLLSGRTPALAASSLQSLIQDLADQSHVTVSRLDVAGSPERGDGPFPMIPATVSAIGDIYGITELLSRFQHGPMLLEVQELTVRPNPALRGELLQMTVTLLGPYLEG